jgi:hypothetical protein
MNNTTQTENHSQRNSHIEPLLYEVRDLLQDILHKTKQLERLLRTIHYGVCPTRPFNPTDI